MIAVAIFLLAATARPEARPEAVDVRVSGRVLDAATQRPLAGAVVYVREWRATCDPDGRFFILVPPGRWTVETGAGGYQTTSVAVDACRGCRPEVEVLLVPKHLLQESVDVSATVSGGELSATNPVRPTEVLNVAGAFENVFRVLQTLPGVTGTGEWSSHLSVRGGGPDQNLTVMDGVEIHDPYRLYGLVSAFNPEIVQGFDLQTGAFPAPYGDRLSSILTVDTRNGSTTAPVAGSVGVSLTDGNGVAEGRLPGQAGSWLVTGRRTWYDLVARRFSHDDNQLPSFADLQGRLAFDLGRGRSFTLSGLRSRERSDFDITEDFDSGVIESRTTNDLASANLFLPLGSRGSWRTIGAYYDNSDDFTLDGTFRAEVRRSNSPYDDLGFSRDQIAGTLARGIRDLSLRQEITYRPFGRHVLAGGFELHDLATRERLQIDLGQRPQEGLRQTNVSFDTSRSYRRYGAWLEDRLEIGRLALDAGVRWDQSTINGIDEIEPRASLRLRLAPATSLRAAFGVHTQSPGLEKLLQADYVLDFSPQGRLQLDNERAQHYVLGLEHQLAPGLTARVEGFYKHFPDLIVGRLETDDELQQRLALYDFPPELQSSVPRQRLITPYPVNQASGRAYGFDAFLACRPTSSASRLSGWLAYTYTSADRTAYGRTYPFEYEQPHALSLVASVRAHQRLEVSLTGRFASGFPRTPPLGLYVAGVRDTADSNHDGVTDEVVPERDADGALVYAIDYGGVENLDRARSPFYARLDGRVTFIPRWGKGRWRIYVDLINVLSHDNGLVTEKLAYDPAAQVPRMVVERSDGFPFLPSFGVHVRF